MTSEKVKILTLAAAIGFSVAVTTILFRYYSNKDNNLSSFSAPEEKTTTTSTTSVAPNESSNVRVTQTNERPVEPILDIEELIAKCGFCRPEMVDQNRESPNNSIHTYQRHYFICTGISSENWPAKLYTATPLLEAFSQVLKKYDDSLSSTVVNASDIPPLNKDTLDLIIFPEMIKLVGLTAETMEQTLEYFKDNGNTFNLDTFPSNIQVESLPSSSRYIFICTHKQKDKRCGYCGPILVDNLRDEVKERALDRDIQVFGTSHVGGHKYAGNVLIFPPGNWYGYVTPDDVPSIIDSAITGDIIQKLHRGTMGTEIIKPEKKDKKQH